MVIPGHYSLFHESIDLNPIPIIVPMAQLHEIPDAVLSATEPKTPLLNIAHQKLIKIRLANRELATIVRFPVAFNSTEIASCHGFSKACSRAQRYIPRTDDCKLWLCI
jgi:hypothetical protein